MKKTIFAIIAIMAGITFVSCEDEKEPIPPTFKGFTYSPKPVHAGDSLQVTSVYEKEGAYVYFVGHKGIFWTLTLDTLNEKGARSTWSKKYEPYSTVADGAPQIKLKIPNSAAKGKATIKLEAVYSNAVDAKATWSRSYKVQSGYEGSTFTQAVTSTLTSKASGDFTFNIE